MPVWVSKEAPGSTGTPEIELHVVFPGEANSAQRLYPGVASLPVTIAYKRFCHAHCLGNFIWSVVQGVSSIVDGRACAGQVKDPVSKVNYPSTVVRIRSADQTPSVITELL
jgi:hypothetical protein